MVPSLAAEQMTPYLSQQAVSCLLVAASTVRATYLLEGLIHLEGFKPEKLKVGFPLLSPRAVRVNVSENKPTCC